MDRDRNRKKVSGTTRRRVPVRRAFSAPRVPRKGPDLRSSKWVKWYSYKDPLTGDRVIVQADASKPVLEIFEDELIEHAKEFVTLKDILGKMNRRISRLERKVSGLKAADVFSRRSSIRPVRVLPRKSGSVGKIASFPKNSRKRRIALQRRAESSSFERDIDKWKKYWESLTGDSEHKFTECVKKVRKAGFADDPRAFCAKLRDTVEGKDWRKREARVLSRKKRIISSSILPFAISSFRRVVGRKRLVSARVVDDKRVRFIYVDGGKKKIATVNIGDRKATVKTAGITVEVPLGNKKVQYDIPTRTVTPLPKRRDVSVAVEDGAKGRSEITVGQEAGGPAKQKPKIDVGISKDDLKVRSAIARDIARRLIASNIIPPEEEEEYVHSVLEKYKSVDDLRNLKQAISSVLRDADPDTTYINPDTLKPENLSDIL